MRMYIFSYLQGFDHNIAVCLPMQYIIWYVVADACVTTDGDSWCHNDKPSHENLCAGFSVYNIYIIFGKRSTSSGCRNFHIRFGTRNRDQPVAQFYIYCWWLRFMETKLYRCIELCGVCIYGYTWWWYLLEIIFYCHANY